MRCENIMPMLDDLLDKTLSPDEAREVEKHLFACESCRRRFVELKKADGILREVVREMVAAVEVPSGLGDRVEKRLAGEQKKPLVKRLPAFLKNPAVAAAVLLLVAAAGIFSFHYPLKSEVKQIVADSSETRKSNTANNPVAPAAHGDDPEAGQTVVPEKINTSSAQDRAAAGDNRRQPEVKPEVKQENKLNSKVEDRSGGQQSVSALDQASPLSAKAQSSQEKHFLTAARAAGGKGTLEEAARELGFSPARPSYLPPGAELQDVTWFSDAVYQNYRDGQITFVISQSKANIKASGADESSGQGTAIEINGAKAVLQESKAGAGDSVSRGPATVQWQRGEWTYSVTGQLPGDEIIKIASSLK